jgi:BolA family transcriptional regulator, general stress-responsive regulator
MIIQTQIKEKLTTAFAPNHLEIFDESYKHAGHAGAPTGSSETHIGIIIVSDYFKGLSRIDRSRSVFKTIAEEIKKIHAITVMKTLTPEEYKND